MITTVEQGLEYLANVSNEDNHISVSKEAFRSHSGINKIEWVVYSRDIDAESIIGTGETFEEAFKNYYEGTL